jgi:SAM-dependent methyltransferase
VEDLATALDQQERAWNERPLVRRVYRDWYRMIVRRLAEGPGDTIELGAGIGKFLEARPDAILTDIEPTRWTNRVVDAHALPSEAGTVRNLVLLDVFHHLADPTTFFDEAERVLAPGGRVVIVDPYCSPVSTPLYRRFHHERADLSASPLERDEQTNAAPLESNQARATLIFYRHLDEYRHRWPSLPMIEQHRFAMILYPLSGGFTRPALIPRWAEPLAAGLERLLTPASRLLAFRCLVVLEKSP